MTVRDLLATAACDVGLSFWEDPTNKEPEILLQFRNGEIDEADVLSEKILNSNIHLLIASCNNSYHGLIHATIFQEE